MNAKPVVLVGIWWLGLTGAIMLAGTAPTPVCYAAEPAIAAARSTKLAVHCLAARSRGPGHSVRHRAASPITATTANGAGYARPWTAGACSGSRRASMPITGTARTSASRREPTLTSGSYTPDDLRRQRPRAVCEPEFGVLGHFA